MNEARYKDLCIRLDRDLRELIDLYIREFANDPWTLSPEEFKKKRHVIQNLNEFHQTIHNKPL